ncbi:hypothetical protein N6Y36_08935 [Morganella morganii]|nr:hypothetical protein N6Y36_08935 [Morganella morganii]
MEIFVMVENSERVVFVDYLAFSAPISVMKEVHTFQEKGFEWRKFQYLPAYRYYQNSSPYIFSDGYQEVPAIAVSPLTEDQQSRYFEDLYACYFSRLKTWIASLFGLVVGAPRAKGDLLIRILLFYTVTKEALIVWECCIGAVIKRLFMSRFQE